MTKRAVTALAAIGLVIAGVSVLQSEAKVREETVRVATKPVIGLRSVVIRKIPHIKQKPDFCGEACVAMFLQKLGKQADQDFVFDQSKLDPKLGRGCFTRELQAALTRIGFRIGQTWYKIDATNATAGLQSQFAKLHSDLTAGVPSIICMHYDDQPGTTEHFRLIVGYDAAKDEVLYHEPAVKNGGYRRMSRTKLLKLWPLKYDAKTWTVIRMPLAVDRLRAAYTSAGHTDADYAQHIMQLKKKIPGAGFHIVIQKPFVVIGDEAAGTVRSRSVRTVKWAVDNLKKVYFKKDPSEILDIWLFKDKESYEKNTKRVFNDRPTTPFGYYSSTHRALVMNIATGGGTLVHEIVHPFMATNFPKCPSWFNEGLASLYEQCGEKNGRITGNTNWRLNGLKQAIRAGKVPSFKTLCSTTTRQFYNQDPGTNYSQGRYLCYYLQEKGLLVKYFNAFRKNAARDPGGYETLKATLGVTDMAKFKKDWQSYVLALR